MKVPFRTMQDISGAGIYNQGMNNAIIMRTRTSAAPMHHFRAFVGQQKVALVEELDAYVE